MNDAEILDWIQAHPGIVLYVCKGGRTSKTNRKFGEATIKYDNKTFKGDSVRDAVVKASQWK